MNAPTIISVSSLPALIDRASSALTSARSSAEVLEARDFAAVAYDVARRAARLEKAKGAHDTLVAAAHRAQADALEIEAQAKRRLADEYDAAQERGEVRTVGNVPEQNNTPTASDIGISRKEIHEAREIRDAEEAEPGIVRRALDIALSNGEEPTRAAVKRVIKPKTRRKRHARQDPNNPAETQHDRDLRMLLGVWEAACETAREEFRKNISN